MSKDAKTRRTANLATPSILGDNAVQDIAGALNALLADFIALYMKTKNFHWHVSGPHFRDYHLMLDEQAAQIFAATDPIAERVRKLGATTLRSTGQVGRLQRIKDNDADYVTPQDMLAELRDDNKRSRLADAGDAQRVRGARRRRHRQPARGLDRRGRAAGVVPVRGRSDPGHRELEARSAEPGSRARRAPSARSACPSPAGHSGPTCPSPSPPPRPPS